MKRWELSWSFRAVGSLLLIVVFSGALFIPRGTAAAQVPAPLRIVTDCCGTAATVGTEITLRFTAEGGRSPYEFTTDLTSVPPGFTQRAIHNGIELIVTPTSAGSFPIVVTVRDNRNTEVSFSGTLIVNKMTPSLSITSVVTTHPSGTIFMTNYPVIVSVEFHGAEGVNPGEAVAVVAASVEPVTTPPTPPSTTVTCDAVLNPDSGSLECDLVFDTTQSFTISASYPGDANYNPSPTVNYSGAFSVTAFSVMAALSAGTTHTCFMDAEGFFSCWGYNDAYKLDEELNPLVYGPVKAISAGGYHTCFIKADSTVECWGDNPNIESAAFPDAPGRKFVSISSGRDFACAIDTRSRLYCWGTLPSGLVATPAGQYQSVSAGSSHACALRKSDAVPTCWGLNASGQLNVPTGLSGVKVISAGNTHTCAITSANGLSCWGTLSEAPPSGLDYSRVESGSDYSCAQHADNRLDCWGSKLQDVDTETAFDGFSSGFLHTCAWIEDSPKKRLSCWGSNNFLQAPRLTLSPTALVPYANYIPLGDGWSQRFVSGGGSGIYSLSLTSPSLGDTLSLPETYNLTAPTSLADDPLSSESTLTWMPGEEGNYSFALTLSEDGAASSLPLELSPLTLGDSYDLYVQSPDTTTAVSLDADTANAGAPVKVSVQVEKVEEDPGPPVSGTVIVTGTNGTRSNTCRSVLLADGTASCTLYFAYAGTTSIRADFSGNSFYNSSFDDSQSLLIEAITISPLVSAGNMFNCSLDSAGIPTCWGKNDTGQAAPYESVYNTISAGNGYTCGSSQDSNIYCWGWGGYWLNTPTPFLNYQSVASGSLHACGLTYSGTISCWGSSAGGRTLAPTSSLAYSAVTAGEDHTCALDSAQHVTCWGVSTHGQTDAPNTTFTQISAGGTFTCGIHTDGTLECWGGVDSSDPILSEREGSYLSLDAGYSHACAVRNDNQVLCWGDTAYGKATPPARTFSSVSAGSDHTCGIRMKTTTLENDALECWGSNALGQAPAITIQPQVLESIDVGEDASIQILASGGRSGQFTYLVAPGSSLPDGMEIDSASGLIGGEPTSAGEYDFTLRVLEDLRTPALIAEQSYHLTIRSDVNVNIVSITPDAPQTGGPVTIHLQVTETPERNFSATPPGGSVTVHSTDGKSCQVALSPDGTGSAGSCTIFFTESGDKTLTASYPGDAHFLAGSTAAPVGLSVIAFHQSARIHTSIDRSYIHQEDGGLLCIGANCLVGGLTGRVTTIGVGETETCALGLDGQVRCRDAITPASDALAVLEHGPYLGLALGKAHACAIQLDGSVFCWGDNTSGQALPLGGAFLSLSAGAAHTCGIRAGNLLECWGNSGAAPAGQFQAVSAGDGFSCALRTDGSISCWGDNNSGQTDAPASGVFTALSVADAHACALEETTGKVICWGENSSGQAASPYGVFSALSAGGNHNCALRPDLGLTCWGGNEAGEAPKIQVSSLEASELVAGQYWEFAFNPSGGRRPYQGSVAEGVLPQGIDLEVNLSSAGVILYGTPQAPGDYPFVLRWQDMPSITQPVSLVLERPYALRVTGGDLAVAIRPAGPVAMADNTFRFEYTIRVLTVLPVPSVKVMVQVPEGWSEVLFRGLDDCSLSGQTLTCTLASLDPAVEQVLSVEGRVSSTILKSLETRIEAYSTLPNWPDLFPANNTAAKTIPVAHETVVFTDDFSIPTRNSAWSAGTIQNSPSGLSYLGDFSSDERVLLQLRGLVPHKWVEITLDLYIIGSWQGNHASDPSTPSLWSFGETGLPPRLATTFCNVADCLQAYPKGYPGGSYPAWSGAKGINELGSADAVDSRYQLKLRFKHTSDALDLTFLGEHLPPGAVWGLDQARVEVGSGIERNYLPLLRSSTQ